MNTVGKTLIGLLALSLLIFMITAVGIAALFAMPFLWGAGAAWLLFSIAAALMMRQADE